MRLDKYLKVSRIIKRRTVAKEAGEGGRVSLSLPIRYLEGEGRLEATLEVQEV